MLLALLVFVALIGASCGIGYTSLRDLPSTKTDMMIPQTGAPSTVYDANGNQIASLGLKNSIPVSFDDVPLVAKQAVLATEDTRFYDHKGVDLRAIMRALFTDLIHGEVLQGGSTITQQVAKNVFLNPSRSIKRKIQEAFLAIELERHYTKDEIFEMYLNCVYFGEGAWGIGAAAKTYFNRDVQNLTLGEAALLAGMLQAPSYYSPYSNLEGALKRRQTVLNLMVEQGFITPEEAQQASQEPLKLKNGMPRDEKYPYPYFVDYIIQELGRKYGEGAVFRGGMKIYTTLDPRAQKAAEDVAASPSYFPYSVRDSQGLLQPQTAIVFLDPQTGAIKAMVGGRQHTARLGYNRATQAYRQPGSAIKPIIAYAPAIEYLGLTPDSTVEDAPVAFGNYRPKNYDGMYRGTITLREALAYSVNIPAVKLLNLVGLERGISFAREMGITTLDAKREGLSAALGGLDKGVTPLQMAAAYSAFANGGAYYTPYAVARVEDSAGNVLEEAHPYGHRVMSSQTASAVTEMLQAAVRYGTGKRARISGLDVAGKTGTTEEGKDIWFCGYTQNLVGVVWIGWDMPKAMPNTYGGIYCARIWREITIRTLGITATSLTEEPAQANSESSKEASGETEDEATQENGEAGETLIPGNSGGQQSLPGEGMSGGNQENAGSVPETTPSQKPPESPAQNQSQNKTPAAPPASHPSSLPVSGTKPPVSGSKDST